MEIYVANPIYDSVFKYIMEDDRIAKTILSALLKKEVVSVEVRPHEYANEEKDKISMLRIDFGAKIKEPDGKTKLILIELQKTWVETETLRFRQYLGAQYANKHNIDPESPKQSAYPMVAIYLMGHRVGDIDVPVLYVSHNAYDYNGNVVTHGMPDPFVESLVHDSIIVQIPLLHGKINKHLDKVLSVFDQTRADKDNPHLLRLDDSVYAGDDDMEHILHRLTAAAASPKVREEMNVEDTYFSALENRDTQIMKINSELQESKAQLQESKAQLQERDAQLQASKAIVDEQNNMLRRLVKSMLEKGMSIKDIAAMTGREEEEIKKLAE